MRMSAEIQVEEMLNKDRKDTKGKINYLGMPKSAFKARHVIEQEGIAKYGNVDSWKENEPEEGVRKYLNALMSHIQSHNDGEEIDPDGGNPHIYKVLWNAVAVVWHYERLVANRNKAREEQLNKTRTGIQNIDNSVSNMLQNPNVRQA